MSQYEDVPDVILPLGNMALFLELIDGVMSRPRNLPGIGVFYGPSGYGKTTAATYGANKHRAYYVEVGESWSKAFFIEKVLVELGQPSNGTYAAKVERAIIALKLSRRPLVIDETNHMIKKNYIGLVRELHDKSGAAIILIGTEILPSALQEDEQNHNRVLDWKAAQKVISPSEARKAGKDQAEVDAMLKDIKLMSRGYVSGIEIADDLLDIIAEKTLGRIRRIAVNLHRIKQLCIMNGWSKIDAGMWGSRPIYDGVAPPPRTGV